MFRLVYIILLSFLFVPLSYADVDFKLDARSGSDNVRYSTKIYFYKPGEYTKHLFVKHAGTKTKVPEGTYDLKIVLKDGAVKSELWKKQVSISEKYEDEVNFNVNLAEVRFDFKNQGKNANYDVTWKVFPVGEREQHLNKNLGGAKVTFREGTYDVGIFYKKGNIKKNTWLLNKTLQGKMREVIQLDQHVSSLLVHITDGKEKLDYGYCRVYQPIEGKSPDSTEELVDLVGGTFSDQVMPLKEGTYHLACSYGTQKQKGETLVRDVIIKGQTELNVDLKLKAINFQDIHLVGEDINHGGSEFEIEVPESQKVDDMSDKAEPAEIKHVLDEGELTLPDMEAITLERDPNMVSFKVSISAKERERAIEKAKTSNFAGDFSVPHIQIIFDASGSMWGDIQGKTKIEIAKQVVNEVLEELPLEGSKISLRVYGREHKSRKNCQDSDLLVTFEDNDLAKIKSIISDLNPNGVTPIAYSLEEAAKDFPKKSNSVIVLVTDGIESCGGDPCKVAAGLARRGVLSRSYVVGFGLDRNEKQFLDCIGNYFSARDKAQLKAALKEVLKKSTQDAVGSVSIFEVGSKNLVANGIIGEEIFVPVGVYDIHARVGSKVVSWSSKEIKGDTVETLD